MFRWWKDSKEIPFYCILAYSFILSRHFSLSLICSNLIYVPIAKFNSGSILTRNQKVDSYRQRFAHVYGGSGRKPIERERENKHSKNSSQEKITLSILIYDLPYCIFYFKLAFAQYCLCSMRKAILQKFRWIKREIWGCNYFYGQFQSTHAQRDYKADKKTCMNFRTQIVSYEIHMPIAVFVGFFRLIHMLLCIFAPIW